MKTKKRIKKAGQKKTWAIIWTAFVCAAASLVYIVSRPKDTAPEYVFSYAENQTADYPTTLAALKFAELVNERTQGRIQIQVKPEGALGSEAEVIRQMRYGGIDFARISIAQISDFVPEMSVLQLPYLYKDSEHMWRILDGEIGEQFLTYTQQYDLIGLSWYDAGARNLYCSKWPVRTLKDMRGLRIRVQEAEMMSEIITALGGVPVQVPYDQVYATLERGRADGAENNWSSYETMQHYEVAKYFTVDEHMRIPEIQICAKHTWDQLSEEDREIIRECARESALYERELWIEHEKKAREIALANGVEEIVLSAEEKEKFVAATESVYEKYYEDYGEVIEQIISESKQ